MAEPRGRGRVLVVDDDVPTLEAIGCLLEVAGFVVEPAQNGAVAVEKFLTFRPDVVLFDFWMPAAGGRELLSGLREVATSRVGLVAMSGTPEVEDWCRRVGIRAFLRKPFDPPDLLAAIVAELEHATPSMPPPTVAESPSARRLAVGRTALVVGDGPASRELHGILRRSEPQLLVACVALPGDALRAMDGVSVDAIAVCEAQPGSALDELVSVASSRRVPLLLDDNLSDAPPGRRTGPPREPSPAGLAERLLAAVEAVAEPAPRSAR